MEVTKQELFIVYLTEQYLLATLTGDMFVTQQLSQYLEQLRIAGKLRTFHDKVFNDLFPNQSHDRVAPFAKFIELFPEIETSLQFDPEELS